MIRQRVAMICRKVTNGNTVGSKTINAGWWFQSLWKIWVRQLGWLFQIYGKIKNVPNHQPVKVLKVTAWLGRLSPWSYWSHEGIYNDQIGSDWLLLALSPWILLDHHLPPQAQVSLQSVLEGVWTILMLSKDFGQQLLLHLLWNDRNHDMTTRRSEE